MLIKNFQPTKERIFAVCIDLFSKKGYENVTVREIAKNAGITESTIYNHFSNKSDILESILNYYKENVDTSDPFNISKIQDGDSEELYKEGLNALGKQFENPYMSKILKLIFLEIPYNEKLRTYHWQELVVTPTKFCYNIFKNLENKKVIKEVDLNKLAELHISQAQFIILKSVILNKSESKEIDMSEIIIEISESFEFIVDSIRL